MSNEADTTVSTGLEREVAQAEKSSRTRHRAPRRGPPACRFFQQGKICRNGNECPFLHIAPTQSAVEKPTNRRSRGGKQNAKTNKSFRQTQIESLLRTSKWTVKPLKSDRDLSAFAIEMAPSDPEFPFEVSLLIMALLVPTAYPATRSSDDIVSIRIANKDIPAGVKQNVESGFAKHVRSTSNKAIDAGDPEGVPSLEQYLDWLDANLELLMQQKPAPTIKFTTFADNKKPSENNDQSDVQKQQTQQKRFVPIGPSGTHVGSRRRPVQEEVESKLKTISGNFNRATSAARPPISRPTPTSVFAGTSSSDAVKSYNYADQDRRLTELWQLEVRFRTSYSVLRDDAREGTVVSVCFAPTDPDLREYDISKMTVMLTVSRTYPKPAQSQDTDSSFPALPPASLTIDPDSICGCQSKESIWHPVEGRQTYVDYICHRFNEHVVEMPNTSLLRHLNWLDHNIVRMLATPPPRNWIQSQTSAPAVTNVRQQKVTAVARQTPKPKLFEEGLEEEKPWIKTISLEEAGLPDGVGNMNISAAHDSEDDDDLGSSGEANAKDDALESDSDSDSGMLAAPARRGTEIRFGIVQLTNISLAHCHSLNIAVRCNRCKERVEIKGVPQTLRGGKENQLWKSCDTCSTIVGVRFRPDWMFVGSTTLGYLDCSGCAPIDLLPSKFTLTCESCAINDDIYQAEMGYEESEETKRASETLATVGAGSRLITNCHKCYGRIGISLQEPAFSRLQSGIALDGDAGAAQIHKEIERARSNKVSKREELARLGVVPGEPLPDRGACKHFRKSNRWLRFPCCGKAFPCVTCHDEKENHDHVFAQIMLCGFCAKEQRISKAEKTGQCISCGSQVIKKVDGNNAFWQGGAGVRDQTRMNRKDTKKFQGMNKTTAKKKVGPSRK
ncbi:hypothetical protein IWW48_002591 [Coemansia sp. RSA 1200]|nr:hypothetical protein IWW48_002591 [Coemansia sp. RSA 1200]